MLIDFLGDQVALSDSYFGPGSGPVQFGDVQCVGNESSLISCHYATSQCTLGSQAGVICPGTKRTLYIISVLIRLSSYVCSCYMQKIIIYIHTKTTNY